MHSDYINMKRIFQLSLLLIIPLFFGAYISHASAALLYAQDLSSTTATPNTTALGTGNASNLHAFQKLGTGLAGTVATTTIYLSDSGGLGAIVPQIRILCFDDATYASVNAGCSSSAVNMPAENGSAKHLVSTATPIALDGTKYYGIGVGCSSGCSGGTNPNLLTYGSNSEIYLYGDFTTAYNITDLYFTIEGTPAPLGFVTPTNGYSGIDFANWVVNIGNYAVNGDYYFVAFSKVNTTSTSCVTCIDASGTHFTQFADSTGFHTSGSVYGEYNNTTALTLQIPKLEALRLNTTYYAILTHFDTNGDYVEQTSVITFTITSLNPDVYAQLDDYFYVASSTLSDIQAKYATTCDNASSSIPAIWATDGTIQAFGCMITRTAEFGINLFVLPHQWTKGLLGQQWEDFKHVFPFSIFFDLTDTFASKLSNTSSSPALAVEFNWETPTLFSGGASGGGGASGSYNVLIASSTDTITFSNSDTLTNLLGREIVIMLMNGILIIALITMMYIIWRLFFHH